MIDEQPAKAGSNVILSLDMDLQKNVERMLREGMGVLAAPEDPASIAAAIESALGDERRWDRQAIADAARERYGAESVGAALRAIYEEVISRRR